MKKKNDDRWREWIFAGTVCLVLLVLLFSGMEGKKQDRQYLSDYLRFEEAEENYRHKDFEKAFPIYEELAQKPMYQESVVICWGMAQILKYRGEYATSLKYYDRIRLNYPAIVRNEVFVEEYVEVLSLTGDERVIYYQR